eukprot:TRINITY_DN15215_c0_g1_i2.p1 TRINITY_DN15215_c0_g1~~TRINITY_DN15215_c0_g1_i2.p1  ORF type:complete len:220 (-),score=33.28 TRINITY_DN15215_c0_g1_i2:105-764(-)
MQRMLDDFDARHCPEYPARGRGAERTESETARTMERVLAKFEAEAKSPLTNLVTGELSNLMVIQMQSIKVQTESALLQMDRILQANQINFAVMAAMPVVGMLYITVALVKARIATLRRRKEDVQQSQQTMRLLLVEAERALCQCGEDEKDSGQSPLHVGLQIFSLNELYVATSALRDSLSASEWHNLRTDIKELAVPSLQLSRKLHIIQRMYSCYSVFR